MSDRKKNTRQRGSRSHGYGSHKKHRGAGHRGGRGNAGSGKRCDSKRPNNWKDDSYFGRPKMKSIQRTVLRGINVSYIVNHINELVANKVAVKADEVYKLDIATLGFNKLLGAGKLDLKLEVTCEYVSKKAKDKVEAAGGSIVGGAVVGNDNFAEAEN
jgi:large subunit ribosomal protein L15